MFLVSLSVFVCLLAPFSTVLRENWHRPLGSQLEELRNSVITESNLLNTGARHRYVKQSNTDNDCHLIIHCSVQLQCTGTIVTMDSINVVYARPG